MEKWISPQRPLSTMDNGNNSIVAPLKNNEMQVADSYIKQHFPSSDLVETKTA